MSTSISVTAEDIANGRPKHLSRCPVALALARTFYTETVRVYEDYYALNDYPRNWPVSVTVWIERFDKGKPVKPFAFDLEVEIDA
ncbi:MAG TPA: hypothetical protein VEL77_14995 [Rugosimonospora sp.]|nr:hypothetical protein [Rugosimonospora sp.]